MKVATPWNGVQTRKLERNILPSLTVPDQSMSVQEIMRRYAAGLPVTGQKVPLYDEDENSYMPAVETLDLAEIQDIIEAGMSAKSQIDAVKKRMLEKAAKEKEAQREAEIAKAAVEAYKASKKNAAPDDLA